LTQLYHILDREIFFLAGHKRRKCISGNLHSI